VARGSVVCLSERMKALGGSVMGTDGEYKILRPQGPTHPGKVNVGTCEAGAIYAVFESGNGHNLSAGRGI
jgi:hypothetical protein